jgi:hypothetical protein
MTLKNIPSSTKKLFWSCDPTKLDSQANKTYIVHQVLQYGDISDFRWLQKTYSQTEINQTFIDHPRATYQPAAFSFITKFLLHIQQPLEKQNYVSATI